MPVTVIESGVQSASGQVSMGATPAPGDVVVFVATSSRSTPRNVVSVAGMGATWTPLYLAGSVRASWWIGTGATFGGPVEATYDGGTAIPSCAAWIVRGLSSPAVQHVGVISNDSATALAGPTHPAELDQIVLAFGRGPANPVTFPSASTPASGYVQAGGSPGSAKAVHRIPTTTEDHRVDATSGSAGVMIVTQLVMGPLPAPEPPTALAQTGATPTSVDLAWTPPASGAAPTSYEYRIDGGAPVDVGLVTTATIPGLAPASGYVVEVRSIAATGASVWSDPLAVLTSTPADADSRWWTHRLAAALGLDPVADQPIVEVRTYDHATDTWTLDPDLSNGLTGYTITHGRKAPTARTEPTTALLGFATARLPATPPIATRLQVALSDAAVAALGLDPDDAIRFTGEVTDPTVDHEARRTSLVCVGRLARNSRRPVDGTAWPVEDDGARIARILAAVAAPAGVIDAGTVNLAVPDRADTAGRLIDQVTASSLGQLLEQPTGAVDWHDAEHRRDTPVHVTLAASAVFKRITWSQRLDTLVNDLDVSTAAGTVVTVTDTESADNTRYGPWPATADTILTSTLDAYAYGVDVVGRRADPSWQLPDLTVDLLRTIPLADLPAVLTLRNASLIALTGLPAGCPVPAEVYVEGWTETATPRAWQLVASVSDPLISGTGIRWIDWPDTDDYQWQDLNLDVTWFDLARITDPADTL
jgi:hypothetical protein